MSPYNKIALILLGFIFVLTSPLIACRQWTAIRYYGGGVLTGDFSGDAGLELTSVGYYAYLLDLNGTIAPDFPFRYPGLVGGILHGTANLRNIGETWVCSFYDSGWTYFLFHRDSPKPDRVFPTNHGIRWYPYVAEDGMEVNCFLPSWDYMEFNTYDDNLALIRQQNLEYRFNFKNKEFFGGRIFDVGESFRPWFSIFYREYDLNMEYVNYSVLIDENFTLQTSFNEIGRASCRERV